MQLVFTAQFESAIYQTLEFIAADNPAAAKNFAAELKKKLVTLKDFPEIYPSSKYFDIENYRDMTFKGYTIIYYINTPAKQIEVLDFFSWQNR